MLFRSPVVAPPRAPTRPASRPLRIRFRPSARARRASGSGTEPDRTLPIRPTTIPGSEALFAPRPAPRQRGKRVFRPRQRYPFAAPPPRPKARAPTAAEKAGADAATMALVRQMEEAERATLEARKRKEEEETAEFLALLGEGPMGSRKKPRKGK